MEKVNILLSIYDPDINFLRKQLESLNNQTYKNIELLIFDDCVSKRFDRNVIQEIINRFPVKFLPYEDHNLGYSKAFEKLIEYSEGEYIAFCDQDDIWDEHKIEKCVETLKKDHSLMVISDRSIIDINDTIKIKSVRSTVKRKYLRWHTGDDIVKYNIFSCIAPGMSIMMDGPFARTIIPVSKYTGHDKWAICCAGIEGVISYIDEPLVLYRRHGNNVSGVLNGVKNKDDYYQTRVLCQEGLIQDLIKKYPQFINQTEVIKFSQGRIKKQKLKLIRYAYLSPSVALFELFLSITPNFLFSKLLKIKKVYL